MEPTIFYIETTLSLYLTLLRELAILIEPENFEELSHVIIEFLNDKRKCEHFGMQGYEFVHDECNSKEMVRKILNVYEKTIK